MILRRIGVAGWEGEQEKLVIASLINGSNLMFQGERGTGKTYLAKRVARALEVAMNNEYEFVKIDGYAANEEDFIGYALPPTQEQSNAAKKAGERLVMERVYSPNTIAFARFIFIDECTRIPRDMQNRYLGLLDYRYVDGIHLAAQQIWGAANPLTYGSTTPMDEALADRWEMVLTPPSLADMEEADRFFVIQSKAINLVDRDPDPTAAAELLNIVEKGRRSRDTLVVSRLDPFTRYVDAMQATINKDLDKIAKSNSAILALRIDSRRASIILNNIIGTYAASLALGERGTVTDDALLAFQHSFVDKLVSEEGGIDPKIVTNAHDAHQDILKDAEDPIISTIERESDVVRRVALAFRLGADSRDVNAYTQAALNELSKQDDTQAAAFSYVFLSRLAHGDPKLIERIDRYVLDEMFPLIQFAHESARDRSMQITDAKPSDGSFDSLLELIEEVGKAQKDPLSAVALTIAAIPIKDANVGGSNPTNADATRRRAYASMVSRIRTVRKVLNEYVQVLAPIDQPL
jgi:MoxR-like ATPase